MDSYIQRQISQPEYEISSHCGKYNFDDNWFIKGLKNLACFPFVFNLYQPSSLCLELKHSTVTKNSGCLSFSSTSCLINVKYNENFFD